MRRTRPRKSGHDGTGWKWKGGCLLKKTDATFPETRGVYLSAAPRNEQVGPPQGALFRAQPRQPPAQTPLNLVLPLQNCR
ncbi:hypothetical protein DPEC_G00037150 [Dallia pectoralis]|uniref:Uncharacterized protein n=1 Tax=Dallia pectoralis TaxID=75939 RepID=A0ACC2HDQ7_DALPE|nr:hypothetical protein DPEC_G00037150 [Dallia pectoralis]